MRLAIRWIDWRSVVEATRTAGTYLAGYVALRGLVDA
jgi:hypothetical protein